MAKVFESKDKTFTNFQKITDKENKVVVEQVSEVHKLIEYNKLFNEFESSYEEYLCIAGSKRLDKNNDIVRYIKNYLASYKSYIDGMNALLSRSFDKHIQIKFESLVRKAYDDNFEYRFMYNLRNYAQHCGAPISSVEQKIDQEAKIELKVNKFLSDHNGMQKSFRQELEYYESNSIDVGNAIKSLHYIITSIQESILNIIMNDGNNNFLQSAYGLVQFYNKYSKIDGTLHIATDKQIDDLKLLKRDKYTEVKLLLTTIPYSIAIFILKSVSIEYIFKGLKIGHCKGFPLINMGQSVVEKAKFLTGSEFVFFEQINWVRVIETNGFHYKDGYDRYAAIYAPYGLSTAVYNEIRDKFKDKTKCLFKSD